MSVLTTSNRGKLQASYWHLNVPEILALTGSNTEGLTSAEAHKRLIESGRHKKKLPSWLRDLRLFIRQFTNPLVLLLAGAVLFSALLGEQSDVIIILTILIATGLLGFIQERKAGRTIEKLQAMIELRSAVVRDGNVITVRSEEIVPGDLLYMKAGDIIPADCYVVEANSLFANEASLTGESYPVIKTPCTVNENTALGERTNCLWQGSNIVSGEGKALAVHTMEDTVFGGLSASMASITETSFEKGIRHFGFFLMQITLILAVSILGINLLFGRPVVQSLLFALALAVGMAPELLPAINTIAMSAGAKRLLRQKVIVKKLFAIQNLGEVNLLCTDKTGTLTKGDIEVAGVYGISGVDSPFAKELAFINASFQTGYKNPIDQALMKMQVTLPQGIEKTGEMPYDFIRKCLSISVRYNNRELLITKGAFRQVLNNVTHVQTASGNIEPINAHLDAINGLYEKFGRQGFRVLGISYKEVSPAGQGRNVESDMVFAGFILLQDPLKEGLQDALNALKELQVNIKIISGDNKIVAESIGRQIGIEKPEIISGDDLHTMSPEALDYRAPRTDIFAEIEPHQKERIIHALRKSFTVAYMGDGINDVAAINAADVGISIDNACDVARSAADFVLLERNLLVLADGIREGRKTFVNTLKYIFITTGATFGNMFSVAIASLLLPFLPMLPMQILLTNFLSDIPFLAVSTDNVDKEALARSGRWNIGQIRRYMIIFGLHSSLFDLLTFLTLYYIFKTGQAEFRTAWFIESVLTELIIVFIMRTRKPFLTSKPGNLLLWLSVGAFIVTILLPFWPYTAGFGMAKLPLAILISMFGIVILYTVTGDVLKLWFFRKISIKTGKSSPYSPGGAHNQDGI